MSAALSDESVTKRQDRALDFQNEQWELLGELVKPLELLVKGATVFLSKEYNVSCSCVYPILQDLITILEPNDEDVPAIRQNEGSCSSSAEGSLVI